MTYCVQIALYYLHHATKMKPLLDAERNSADTFTTRMTHVATRQLAQPVALEGAVAVASAVAALVSSVVVGRVASAVVLLPVLALLIGLGVILLPEGTRCGPPGK